MCKSSKIITSVDDIEGFDNLKERDKDRIRKCIANHARGGVDVAGAKVIKTASNLVSPFLFILFVCVCDGGDLPFC